MNWKKIIEEIKEKGYNEKEIAEIVDSTQPTINRLKNGLIKEPLYTLGIRLINLHLINTHLRDALTSGKLEDDKKCA